MSGIVTNVSRYSPSSIFLNLAHPLNLGTRFLLGGRIVTPGYSGHWPGYSGCGVSISIIWTSGPHNQLNGNYHSLSPSLSLPPVTSLPLTSLTSSPSPLSSRFRNLPFQLDSKAKGASLDVGDHLLQVFHLGATSFSSFLARKTSSRY